MSTGVPTEEQRRAAAMQHIRQLGDPVLRTPSLDVDEFEDTPADEVERMAEIMREARGVGLAAPQLGSLRRLIVIRPTEDGPTRALCNPTITSRSDEEEIDEEGCLSLGDLRFDVPRSTAVHVEAVDEAGQPIELDAEGFEARVVQHEIDHLNGILIIDRATPESRRATMKALRGSR
ncbi:MAG: peptide deformylase [Firmicutes bacterium]|nr:peptide deformylase [Bacillota bacterium]